jgi:hypothetical protein
VAVFNLFSALILLKFIIFITPGTARLPGKPAPSVQLVDISAASHVNTIGRFHPDAALPVVAPPMPTAFRPPKRI